MEKHQLRVSASVSVKTDDLNLPYCIQQPFDTLCPRNNDQRALLASAPRCVGGGFSFPSGSSDPHEPDCRVGKNGRNVPLYLALLFTLCIEAGNYCSELPEWMAVRHKQQALRRQQWQAMRQQCVLSDMPQGVSARQPPN